MQTEMISTLEMSIADLNSEYLGISRRLLMESAGKGLADLIWEVYQATDRSNIIILAGKGGNGGDGMVAARHLAYHTSVSLYFLGSSKDINKKSTMENWKILQNLPDSVLVCELQFIKDIEQLKVESTSLIVDALLGTGIKGGKIREPLASLIRLINIWQKTGAVIVSADTPSGIDPNSGEKSNVFLSPQWTGIFHKQKKGLSSENAGKIRIIPIGIPPEAEEIVGPGDLLTLTRRLPWSRKGERGKILVIGGNETYSGAPALTAMGAIQSGVDLITILSPNKISTALRSYSPEFMVRDYPTPHLTVDAISSELIKNNDVIVIGPGLGEHPDTKKAVLKCLNLVGNHNIPIVVDADALKLVDMTEISSKTILTPHAGEFAIITDISLPVEPQKFQQRKELVQEIASKFPNVWVVKGHWDIVCDESQRMKINKTGTPRMTRGGTGDILAGLIAGFVSQTTDLFHAASIGTYINGRAGELAKWDFNLQNMLQYIPVAIQDSFDFIHGDIISRIPSQ